MIKLKFSCEDPAYIISPYSIRDKIIVLKTVIHASVVRYLRTFDSKYSLCETNLHISIICLLKLRWSSNINPRYLYEHTLSSIYSFRDKLISLVLLFLINDLNP